MASTGAPPPDFTSFARKLAQAAREQTLARFSAGSVVENKSRNGRYDPVTEADRSAETVMRELIGRQFPAHGIHGEEFADKPAGNRFSWSIDPIDGTRSFICGLPTWTTLIALLDRGDPVLGVVDAPRLDELYIGTAQQSLLERSGASIPLKVSGCTSIVEARLSTTDPYLFTGSAAEAFPRLRSATRTVSFGHDGYAYARLAAGTLDLVVESGLKHHDYAALIPLVRGAGGTFGDWRGGTDFSAGNVIAAATPELYSAAVAILKVS